MAQVTIELLRRLQAGDRAARVELAELTTEEIARLLRAYRDQKRRAGLARIVPREKQHDAPVD